jgi:hypothetical protein
LNQKFCTKRCHNTLKNPISGYPGITPSTVGTIGELAVSIDLLSRGVEVFRALSPACSCDLAILQNGKLLRIEVRSGYFIKNRLIVTNKKHRADVLAVHVRGYEVFYEPNIFHDSRADSIPEKLAAIVEEPKDGQNILRQEQRSPEIHG